MKQKCFDILGMNKKRQLCEVEYITTNLVATHDKICIMGDNILGIK